MDIALACISSPHEHAQWTLSLESDHALLTDANGQTVGRFTPRQAASDWRIITAENGPPDIEIATDQGSRRFSLPATSVSDVRRFQQRGSAEDSRMTKGLSVLLIGSAGVAVGMIALVVGIAIALLSTQSDGSYVIWKLPFIIAALGICGGLLKFAEAAAIFAFGGLDHVPKAVWGGLACLILVGIAAGVFAYVKPPAAPQTISPEERAQRQAARRNAADEMSPAPHISSPTAASPVSSTTTASQIPTTIFDPAEARWHADSTLPAASVTPAASSQSQQVGTTTTVFDPSTFGHSSAAAAQLEIIEATYGAGDRTRDVTDLIQSQMVNGAIDMQVSNSSMGGDPSHGAVKHAIINYRLDGQERQITVREGDRLILPSNK